MQHVLPSLPLPVRNGSMGDSVEWEMDGIRFVEVIRQEYSVNGCVFSAGFVMNHPNKVDTMYIRWVRTVENNYGGMLLLRPDEMATVAWLASGVLYSENISNLIQTEIDYREETGKESGMTIENTLIDHDEDYRPLPA